MSLTLGFWAVQAAGALAAGGLAWVAGQRLHRHLGLSHAAYGYWLGLWLLAVMPVLLSTLVALWVPAPLVALPPVLTMPLPVALDLGDAGTAGGVAATSPWVRPSTAMLLAALYFAGLGVALLRVAYGMRATARLCRATTPIAPADWRTAQPCLRAAADVGRRCLSRQRNAGEPVRSALATTDDRAAPVGPGTPGGPCVEPDPRP